MSHASCTRTWSRSAPFSGWAAAPRVRARGEKAGPGIVSARRRSVTLTRRLLRTREGCLTLTRRFVTTREGCLTLTRRLLATREGCLTLTRRLLATREGTLTMRRRRLIPGPRRPLPPVRAL